MALGLASLFSDAGHEAATAVLPLFLASIGGSAASLGLIEGVADALSTGAKLLSGWFSDGLEHRKPVGTLGYATTGLGIAGLAVAFTPLQVLIVRAFCWFGRGARGPVRDAMLAEAVPPWTYGRAFGFHRAMDTAGAVVGPLIALALVGRVGFRTIFAVTLIPGILSVIAFASVREHAQARTRSTLGQSLRELPGSFRGFLLAVGIFGLGDFARSLLVLRASQLSNASTAISTTLFAVALYVLHNLAHALSAYGFGVLGTYLGGRRVLVGGYVLFAVMSFGFAILPAHPPLVVLVGLFILAGLSLSAEEVLEGTVAADLLPERLLGTGYGALAAVNGIGDFAASAIVGALWAGASPTAGFAYAGVMGLAGAIALARLG